MAGALQRAWSGRGPLARLLLPLSLVYGLLARIHRAMYAGGLRPTFRAPVPVVVVGNVIAGGAGKTPVVIALVQHLRSRGIAAGIVSRGYGRTGDACLEVRPDAAPQDVGDEPLLLRRKAAVPVFVARRRAEAVTALLQAYPGTGVVVSDDGLQHHALARDIEICVFDSRGIGNGWLLPAGPLREPWPRPFDLVLRHGDAAGVPGHAMQRRLAERARRADGTECALAELRGPDIHAVAGIANPDTFFAMLRQAGVPLAGTHALPDHHAFADAGTLPAGGTLLCTEKDAVKLWRLRPDAWAVPLEVSIPDAFWRDFDRLLGVAGSGARLSSPHGSPTP